jgi:hypothetical protein
MHREWSKTGNLACEVFWGVGLTKNQESGFEEETGTIA